MKWTIYHNPRCQKSRQTLNLLEEKGIHPQIIEYLSEPFTEAGLKAVLKKLDLKPSGLLRKKEEKVKKLKLDLTDENAVLLAMVKHPELVERPIVVRDEKAILGRPPENVLSLL